MRSRICRPIASPSRNRPGARGAAGLPQSHGAGKSGRDGRQALRPARRWTLRRVLALFPRLAERAGSMANLLSGGEQQMLAIGRALMTNPQPADPRRGDGRPGAADPRGDLALPRAVRAAGQSISSSTKMSMRWRGSPTAIMSSSAAGSCGREPRSNWQRRPKSSIDISAFEIVAFGTPTARADDLPRVPSARYPLGTSQFTMDEKQ